LLGSPTVEDLLHQLKSHRSQTRRKPGR
jgi:hypothetical protein